MDDRKYPLTFTSICDTLRKYLGIGNLISQLTKIRFDIIFTIAVVNLFQIRLISHAKVFNYNS